MKKPNPVRIGEVIGLLTVVGESRARSRPGVRFVVCRCECDNYTHVRPGALRFGAIKSCGCLSSKTTRENNTTHGLSKIPEYRIWAGMHARCDDLDDPNYGGRGISVCERWMEFENFYADMGPRPPSESGGRHKWSIDRINNDGNYEPSNCKWSTQKEQGANQRKNVNIECFGDNKIVSEWSRLSGKTIETITSRLKKGYSPEYAIFGSENLVKSDAAKLREKIKRENPRPRTSKKHTTILTVNSVSKSMHEWSMETGVHIETIRIRLKRGLSHYDCIHHIKNKKHKYTEEERLRRLI